MSRWRRTKAYSSHRHSRRQYKAVQRHSQTFHLMFCERLANAPILHDCIVICGGKHRVTVGWHPQIRDVVARQIVALGNVLSDLRQRARIVCLHAHEVQH